MIRPARPEDAAAIADIWNPIIRDTTITFTTAEKDPQTLAQEIKGGAPLWVAQGDDGGVVGFACAFQFRGGPGYAHSFEHSVHVLDTQRGKGIGRALMSALEGHLRDAGIHTLFAGVSGENSSGVAFHAALGFAEVARLRDVGRKFGRWHDLVLMQKFL